MHCLFVQIRDAQIHLKIAENFPQRMEKIKN